MCIRIFMAILFVQAVLMIITITTTVINKNLGTIQMFTDRIMGK